MKIIVFDTETSGLPSPNLSLDQQPYICEFASIMLDYDSIQKKLIEISRRDLLINIPIKMPIDSAGVHGINDDMLVGKPNFAAVADELLEYFRQADVAVAHNIAFDKRLIEIELERLGRDKNFLPDQTFDTMLESREMCNLPGKFGKLKSPRLKELHHFLFGESMEKAHEAMGDVEATVRCLQGLADRGMFNPTEPSQGSLF